VPADVVVQPEVEVGLHRLAVAFAEHGLDVGLEAYGLVGVRGSRSPLSRLALANAASNLTSS
jgi:hypothetical protein